jgi:hypothetical protein
MEWSLNGLNLLFLAIGLCLGYWKCRYDNKKSTSAMSAIALALKEHITLQHGKNISKEAFAGLDIIINYKHKL